MRTDFPMKKILSINPKPMIHTYTHHGYFHSVISAPDKIVTDNDTVTKFSVTDFNSNEWHSEIQKVHYKQEEDQFYIYANKWNLDMNLTFWRPCHIYDSIEITIQKQKYTYVWGSVSIYLTKKNANMLNMGEHDLRIGNFSKDGVFYLLQNEDHKTIHKTGLNNTLKLVRNNMEVYMEFKEGETNTRVNLLESLDQDEYMIGFAATFECNSFYEWTFSNYINVFSKFDQSIPFDFLCNTSKDWNFHSSDYFIDYQCESIEEIKQFGYSELDFVKCMIMLGRYVEVDINDNLNYGIPDDNGPFFHHNFIYGFDDDKACIHLFYVTFGRIVVSCLSYDDFESSRNRLSDRKYYVYKYNPGYEGYPLNLIRVLHLFQEFRTSVNISSYECVHGSGYSFGLNCYRELLSEKGFNTLLDDIRISHLMYERAVCNKNRLEYLIEKYGLDESKTKSLSENIHIECEKIMILRNAILKKHFGGIIDINNLREMLISIVSLEECITDEIIVVIENMIKEGCI